MAYAGWHASSTTPKARGAAGWRALVITHLIATCVLQNCSAIRSGVSRVVNTFAVTSNLDVECVPAAQHTSSKDSVCRLAQHYAGL
jgi:hypothetical protein